MRTERARFQSQGFMKLRAAQAQSREQDHHANGGEDVVEVIEEGQHLIARSRAVGGAFIGRTVQRVP